MSAPAQARRPRTRRDRSEPQTVPDVEFTSYYGRQVVKAAPWDVRIPLYMFAGGLAAGSSLLAAGAQLKAFPRPVMEAAYKAAQSFYSDTSGTNPGFRQLHDDYVAFQREQVGWFRVTENTFDDFMAAVLRG